MPAESYSRPASAYRFKNKGLKTNAAPDALLEHEYPYLANVRSFTDDEIQTRPQFALANTTPTVSAPVLSLEPAIGIYKVGSSIYHAGTLVDAGYSTRGASLTPFRPNASTESWEYVWDDLKQTKINVDETDAVTVAATGIAEPQSPVDFGIGNSFFTPISTSFNQTISYSHNNTSAITDTPKVADTVAAVFQDPALPPGTLNEYTVQTTSSMQGYQTGEFLSIGTPDVDCYQVKDVYPALVGTVTIAAIYYYSGTTGRCVVVPFNVQNTENEGLASIQQENLLTGVRRGALVTLGGETCYVLGTAVAPDGTISFEISTTNTHSAGETLTGQPAIKVLLSSNVTGGGGIAPTVGQSISAHYASFTIGTSVIGTIQSIVGITDPFSFQNISYRPDDLLHISVMASDLSCINEMKILFDVSDGSFTTDYYYYTFRPSDIQAGVQNTLTQLGVASIASQRQTIDEEAAAHGTPSTSSTPLMLGSGSWSDIYFPISSLLRVGTNQHLSLLNVNSYQLLVNTNALAPAVSPLTIGFHTIDICGGFSPDAGQSLQGYEYIIRPRSSLTGAKGNPSPRARYTIRSRREEVQVVLPLTYSDPQADVWDIFKRGGTIERFTFIGTVPIGTANFLDNYTDTAVINNPQIEYNLLEPFPSVGPPIDGTANVVGTALVATFPLTSGTASGTLTQLAALLPGNLINIGQQVYTLWTRPTPISTTGSTQTLLFQLQEDAGAFTAVDVKIYEPLLAAQSNAQVWGPDADGVFFAVGDPLRPGFVVRTNPNNPDASDSANTTDLCPPTEPLQNGALLSGTSIAFSTSRAWRGYPQGGGIYRWAEIPVGRGLGARFAICTNGHQIFYVAKDSIRRTGGGDSVSMTDANLFNLFPHEGVTQPPNITYAGRTVFAPDYSKADFFRLSTANGYLYFDYLDSTSTYRTLVCNIATESWSVDIYADPLSIHAATTTASEVDDTIQQQLFGGSVAAGIYTELSIPNAAAESISGVLAMREETYGDIRATKLFGDAMIDVAAPYGMVATPISFGIAQTATTLAAQSRLPAPSLLDLGGQLEVRALGCLFTWTDTGTSATPTILYAFQLSYIVQPASTDNRFQDWDDAGYEGAKWIQGFILQASTDGANKTLTIRDSDTLTTHPFDSTNGTSTINHADQSIRAYSFTTPFIAHMVRYEPDEVPWKTWEIKWIFEPTPESVFTWETQETSHTLPGWQHLRPNQLLAHRSTADLTLTITADGVAQVYTIPNSGGAFVKTLVPLRAVKALVWKYRITSTTPFSLWNDDQELYVGYWGRSGGYENFRLTGSAMGNKAKI